MQIKCISDLNSTNLIIKIKQAIREKESKKNYSNLLEYRTRILIIRINGVCLDWRILEKVANKSNFSEVTLNLFNSVFLILDPVVPTQQDIADNIITPQLNFIEIINAVYE